MRSKFVVTALLKTLCFLLLCGEAISENTRCRGDASSTQLICAAQDLDLFGGDATGARYVKRQAIQHRKRVPADITGDQEKIQANSIRARRTPRTAISDTDHNSSSAYHIGSDEKERNEFPSTSFRSEGGWNNFIDRKNYVTTKNGSLHSENNDHTEGSKKREFSMRNVREADIGRRGTGDDDDDKDEKDEKDYNDGKDDDDENKEEKRGENAKGNEERKYTETITEKTNLVFDDLGKEDARAEDEKVETEREAAMTTPPEKTYEIFGDAEEEEEKGEKQRKDEYDERTVTTMSTEKLFKIIESEGKSVSKFNDYGQLARTEKEYDMTPAFKHPSQSKDMRLEVHEPVPKPIISVSKNFPEKAPGFPSSVEPYKQQPSEVPTIHPDEEGIFIFEGKKSDRPKIKEIDKNPIEIEDLTEDMDDPLPDDISDDFDENTTETPSNEAETKSDGRITTKAGIKLSGNTTTSKERNFTTSATNNITKTSAKSRGDDVEEPEKEIRGDGKTDVKEPDKEIRGDGKTDVKEPGKEIRGDGKTDVKKPDKEIRGDGKTDVKEPNKKIETTDDRTNRAKTRESKEKTEISVLTDPDATDGETTENSDEGHGESLDDLYSELPKIEEERRQQEPASGFPNIGWALSDPSDRQLWDKLIKAQNTTDRLLEKLERSREPNKMSQNTQLLGFAADNSRRGEVPTADEDDLRSYLRNRIDGGRPKSREDTLVLEKDENMRDPEPEEVADRGDLSPAFPEPPPGVNMKAEENQEPPPEEEKSSAELPPTSNTVSWALSSIEREDEDVQTTEPQPDEEDDLRLLLTPPSVIPAPVETPLVEEPLQMISVPVEEPKPKTEEPPSKTEKPPPKTEKPPPKTEKPPPKTEKPPPKTEMPPPKTEKPPPMAEKPPPKTEKPPPKTEMPPPKTEKPPPKTEKPPPKTEEPSPKTENPPPKAKNPPPKAEKPPAKAENPPFKAEEPSPKAEKPPPKAENPPPKAVKPPPTSLSPLSQRHVVTSNNGVTSPKITGAAVPKLNWTDVATAWELSLQEGVELDSTSAARQLGPWRNAQQRHPISQKLEQRQPITQKLEQRQPITQKLEQRQPIPPKLQKPDQRKPSSPPKSMKKSSAIPRATEAAPAEAPKSRLPSFRVTARKANLQREPKILGASFLDLTQHPYVAVLAGKLETRLVFLCTTTILSETWALSCAHCFFVDGEELVINRLVVVTGQTSLDLSNLSPNSAIYVAKEIHIHPMYAEKSFESITHDLGLVRVRRPFKFNDFVQMIPIRALPLPYLTDPDTDTLIPLLTQSFNWNSKTRELEAINVTLRRGDVDPCPCINWRLSRGLFCTFRRPRETICHGDFGGPLVYRRQLIGVAQGIRSARCDRAYILEDEDCEDASKYAMYINTCIFLDWLNRHVPGVPHQPEECYRLLNAEAGQAVASATPVLLVAMASSSFFFVNTL
ncbi:unnamed protein product [Bemisia tabaci]|uniref:Peptidase S1 domain-containing protein n=1 Tax=Bemisia tabaci TaxID=7038 RepID=A0A9P0CE97_BEMTA|nr:unnamed protein product [Bemisia tabaci]